MSQPSIHPTAIIEPGANIAEGVKIGPYCMVGSKVSLAAGVELISHVAIAGHTQIGTACKIYPFASLGHVPQDLKYQGEDSTLRIGARCTVRENVTMNPGTKGGGLITEVGDDCLFMVGSHVAHDCRLGNHVILANNATLAGHVTVGDYAIIGGMSAIHQFCRIGQHAMIGGMSGVETDVIPYGLVMGDRARLAGLNLVGLERRGFLRDQIKALRAAYRMCFAAEGTMAERLEEVARLYGEQDLVREMLSFIRDKSGRALCQPRADRDAA